MKKIIAILFSAITFSFAVSAQSVPSLLINTDAAAVSMGGVSQSLDAETFGATVSYGMWAPQTANASLAGLDACYRLNEKLAFGLSGKLFLDKPYDVVGVGGMVSGTFAPKDIIVGLGASYAITSALSVGATVHAVSSSIGPEANGMAFCADINASYAIGAFNVAVGACNLGTPISYGKDSYALPALAKVSGSWSGFGLTAGAEVDYLFSGALMAGVGVEYGLWDKLFVRGGFHYGDSEKAIPTYASLGLGAKLAGFRLDASYLLASKTLGNTILVSLGYAF